MVICEHTISEYTLNGVNHYNVIIVYKVSEKSDEVVARLTITEDGNGNSVDSIGTERNGSHAEAERIWKLMQVAARAVKLYRMDKATEEQTYHVHFPEFDMPKEATARHTDYRR